MENLELKKIANEVRKGIITSTHSAKAGHPGGSLSAAEVFTYLYNELNKPQCAKLNPDKIYVNMPKAEIANYPTGFGEISMKNLFDVKYKQNLLDQWKY